MIVVFLRGGLGNQMFQYALGRNLSKKYNTELIFDTTFLDDRFPRKGLAMYSYNLDVFGIVPHRTFLSNISTNIPVPGLWLGIDFMLLKIRDILGIRKIIKEQSFAFNQNVFLMGSNIFLWGYWQSEKYFEDIRDEIFAMFEFKTPLTGIAKDIATKIQSTNSVALHVRRGDYVTAPNTRKLMGDTDIQYYERAVAYITKRIESPRFFIISNDATWCKENIKIPFPVTYLDDTSAGPKDIYHMQLMSLCKHNIIANSSFSWWAAWLNRNPEKIVIAPKQWMAGTLANEEDFVPSVWVRM